MRKATLSFILLTLAFFSTGCPRYDAVRRMSTEQLAVQEKLKNNLKDYFKAIDKLLDRQVIAANTIIDDETQNQIDIRNEKLVTFELVGVTDPKLQAPLIAAASQDIATYSNDAATKKQQILDRVALIKAKHVEIGEAYEGMFAAQQDLDHYIQLKKADEVIAETIANKFKLNQDKINNAVTSATNAAGELTKLTGGK